MTLKQKIQALLTAANTKTSAGDTDLTSAVGTLIEGYGGGGNANPLQDAVTLAGVWSGANYTQEKLVINAPKCTSISGTFRIARGSVQPLKEIDITFGTLDAKGISSAFRYFASLETIRLHGDLSRVTNYTTTFDECSHLSLIDGELDYTSVTSGAGIAAGVGGNASSVSFRCVPNTLKVSASYCVWISANKLTTETLISVANALNESVEGKTISIAGSSRFPSILGTVSLDPTETFHIFAEDPTGTVTLTDFIVNTKGWTIS